MKGKMIMLFMCMGFVAMAQQSGDGKAVQFSSPEPSVIKVENTDAPSNTKERVVFTSAEPTVHKSESGNTAAQPRVEFTSPEPTTVTTGKKDDK